MTTNVITVGPEEKIKDSVQKMEKCGIKELPVVSEGKMLGMITYFDIIEYVQSAPDEKVHEVMVTFPTIAPDTTINEMSKLMLQSGIEALPVMEKGKLVGIVSDFDIVKEAIKEPKITKMKVKDIFHPIQKVITENETISAARRIMRFSSVDRIPVVDKENRLLGMVISIDILRKFLMQPQESIGRKEFATKHLSPQDMPVSAVLRKNIPHIYIEDSVPQAVSKMLTEEIKGIPVLDKEDKVIGMLMRKDILDQMAETNFEDGVWLNFSGFKLKSDTVDILRSYLSSRIRRVKILEPDTKSIDAHIKTIHAASEDKWNYEINMSLAKESGKKEIATTAKAHYGYNLMFTLAEALDKITEQLEHKQKKHDNKSRSTKK